MVGFTFLFPLFSFFLSMNFPGRGYIYDVALVGAGICGTEAALACAKAGLDVLLVTTILDTCYNLVGDGAVLQAPADTFMAEAVTTLADEHGFVTTWELHRAAKFALEHTPGIHFLQSSVSSLITENNRVTGISTWEGVPRYAKYVVLCVGSFFESRLTIGHLTEHAGRLSEMSYDDLYLDLVAKGFQFDSLQLKALTTNDSPSYTVDCKVFAQGEIDPVTFGSSRLEHLYAAGTCAFGYTSYEAAAQQGRQLAEQLRQKTEG
jgi:tRNA U34 5-carboxymethylaminomethyl modifying enzyme MnmG/GidA